MVVCVWGGGSSPHFPRNDLSTSQLREGLVGSYTVTKRHLPLALLQRIGKPKRSKVPLIWGVSLVTFERLKDEPWNCPCSNVFTWLREVPTLPNLIPNAPVLQLPTATPRCPLYPIHAEDMPGTLLGIETQWGTKRNSAWHLGIHSRERPQKRHKWIYERWGYLEKRPANQILEQ